MTRQRERRRQFIVDKGLQSRVIYCGAILPFVTLLMITFILGYYVHYVTTQAGVNLPWFGTVLMICGGFLLLSGSFVVWNLVQLSHRIAGPIYNISRTLGEVRAGDSSQRVRLRKHDYLGQVQDDLNDFLEWHEENFATAPETVAEAPADEPVTAPLP